MKFMKNAAAAMITAATMVSLAGYGEASAAIQKIEAETNVDGNYNILFIATDQEHYFSEYPIGTSYKARELLAELGTTFEKHYTCSNMSSSSRSVIYTGTHITDTAMIDNTDFEWQGLLDNSLTTVGDMMRQAGYYTAYKGKWHMGDAGIIPGTEAKLSNLEEYGFADWGGIDYIGSAKEGDETDPAIASEAVIWLDSTGKGLNENGQSFFLAVNMINPHDIMNYDTTGYQSKFLTLSGASEDDTYKKSYNEAAPSTWNFDLTSEDVPDALRLYQKHWGLFAGTINDQVVWQDYQSYYYNCIQDNDNSLVNILTYLIDNGMLDNTIIVFTSDHGEMHGSHGLKGKGGFMYENNVHVPLIIVHPDYEGGKKISSITSHVDLAKTFVDMTNISEKMKAQITLGLPGKSLLDLMDGSRASIRDGALFCYEMLSMTSLQISADESGKRVYSFDTTARGMVRGIVTDKYKFVRYFAPTGFNTPTTLEQLLTHNDLQLFNLKNDPDELVNLAAEPEANEVLIMEMNAMLNQLIDEEIGIDDGQEVLRVLRGLQAN